MQIKRPRVTEEDYYRFTKYLRAIIVVKTLMKDVVPFAVFVIAKHVDVLNAGETMDTQTVMVVAYG